MKTLEELKKSWDKSPNTGSAKQSYDQLSLETIFKSRMNKHTKASMQYFWASFVLQIIVYALLSHVIVKYWSDYEAVALAIGGILLYLPFTIMLMRKFKRLATAKLIDQTEASLHQYVLTQHTLLVSFYRFKKRYEFLLIPVSCAIGTILTFNLFVPGGVYGHKLGAGITFMIALLSCAFAIWSENRKSFDRPIQQFEEILDEFKSEA